MRIVTSTIVGCVYAGPPVPVVPERAHQSPKRPMEVSLDIEDVQRPVMEIDQFGQPRVGISQWDVQTELVPMQVLDACCCGPTEVTLGQKLGAGRNSAVYAVKELPNIAIKYHAYCGGGYYDRTETILNEASILQMLAGSGLTNDYYYHSLSMELPLDMVGKIPKIEPCSPGDSLYSTPIVRYLITERVGAHLWAALNFHAAIEKGTQIFELIRGIHARNIIHGDIHAGNIAHSLKNEGKLVLIDFGRGQRIQSVEEGFVLADDPPVDLNAIVCHGYSTPWESRRLPMSFRDDLFRWLITMADLMHELHLGAALDRVCHATEYRSVYWGLKTYENLFDVAIPVKVGNVGRYRSMSQFFLEDITNLTPAKIRMVRNTLKALLDNVRKLRAHEKPDYDQIAKLLSHIQRTIA